MERKDDFKVRRVHLASLSEEELETRFWQLTEKLMDPILELARTHTTPSIERSVLLRMGFSSIEADSLVKQVVDHGLISKGAGHIVYKAAKIHGIAIRDAGLQLAEGKLWNTVDLLFSKDARPRVSTKEEQI